MDLFLSDDRVFQTLEGESISAGRNSVFMRLSMCNLTCKGWATPENPNGCDSAVSWRVKNRYTQEELLAFYEEKGFHRFLQRGDIWKLTGGEPLIQQKALFEFVKVATERWALNRDDLTMQDLYGDDWEQHPSNLMCVEIETNGTLLPDEEAWLKSGYVPPTSFIVSPKLANNGDPREKAYKQDVLRWHAQNESSTFKFVVTCEADVNEIWACYLDPFKIEPSRVWLMPEGVTTAQLKAKAPWVAELCKKYGFNFSNRLHIFIWEQALGV